MEFSHAATVKVLLVLAHVYLQICGVQSKIAEDKACKRRTELKPHKDLKLGPFVVDSGSVEEQERDSYVRGCYFTNWSQYRPGIGKFSPNNYIPGLCTHVFYAFAKFNERFDVLPVEWNDESTTDSKGQFELVNDLKKKDPKLKTLLAIGGWNFGTELFTSMSSTAENRKHFIYSLIPYLRKWNFDGFDIDWEYPSTTNVKKHFTSLVKEVREAFEEEAEQTGNARLLFTAAVSAGVTTANDSYDIAVISKYLDFVNLMSYDFHGSWETVTGINSPLYARRDETGGEQYLNTNYAAHFWASQGMPKEKIIIGIATYGRGWTLEEPVRGSPGVGAKTTGASAATPIVQSGGFAAFYEFCLMLKNNTATQYWQSEQKTPYLIADTNQWFSYDNENSVIIKMKWLKKLGYGGAFVWTLDFDDFNANCASKKYPLIRIIQKMLTK